MPATTKYDEGLRQMHAHIPLTIHQKLAARAKKNHRSITGEAIAIIDQVLTAAEQQEQGCRSSSTVGECREHTVST